MVICLRELVEKVYMDIMSYKIEGLDDMSERQKTYLSRLSTTNDMLPEEQSRNNDIFSPKPVNDTSWVEISEIRFSCSSNNV